MGKIYRPKGYCHCGQILIRFRARSGVFVTVCRLSKKNKAHCQYKKIFY